MFVGPHLSESFHFSQWKAMLQGLGVPQVSDRAERNIAGSETNACMLVNYLVIIVKPGT